MYTILLQKDIALMTIALLWSALSMKTPHAYRDPALSKGALTFDPKVVWNFSNQLTLRQSSDSQWIWHVKNVFVMRKI